MSKITYTFKNGITLTETIETLAKIATGFGEEFVLKGYYQSESKGLSKISDMHSHHVRYALLKCFSEEVAALKPQVKEIESDLEFAKRLTQITEASMVAELFTELVSRG